MSRDLIAQHDAAYAKAQGCPVYAPKQGTDAGLALYHATRSGGTSAAASDDWMRIYAKMLASGLVSTKYPHLFRSKP